jgi:hypothetical protein
MQEKQQRKRLMKTTILYSLVLLTMLGIGLSCKKVIEEVKPPVVTKPGSSTQPTSTTPVSANNRIVRMVFKEERKQIFENVPPEPVVINGKLVFVNKKSETTYFYDGSNRLVLEVSLLSDTRVDSTRFYYYPSFVISAGYGYDNGKLGGKRIDTVIVDGNGFMKQFSGVNYVRDKHGYILQMQAKFSKSIEVVDGNIIKVISSALEGNGNFIQIYEYDSTRYTQLPPRAFLGYDSKNLALVETISEDRGTSNSTWAIYIRGSNYVFDSQGRIIQKIGYAQRTNTGFWPYTTLPSVTEYYYAP